MEYIFIDGKKVDMLGFGTYKMSSSAAREAVPYALEAGYRRIDTATMYDNEEGIGEALAECGIPRGELFLTTKLWTDIKCADDVFRSVEGSLKKLRTSYIDMLLIHWPTENNLKVWKGMEKLKKEGVLKGIGLSNFKIHHIEDILKEAQIKPEWNQLEIHPYFQNRETVDYCKKQGIVAEAWSPLKRGEALKDPVINGIAAKYGKSAAQVILRYDITEGVAAVPKSTNPERIKENISIFDFSLSDEDIEKIKKLDSNKRSYRDPDNHGF